MAPPVWVIWSPTRCASRCKLLKKTRMSTVGVQFSTWATPLAMRLELVSEFAVRHGEGVALGMVAAAQMAVALGRCDAALADRIAQLLERVGLPTSISGYDMDAVLAAMGHDKKRAGKTLRFVIPQALGDVVVIDDPGVEVVQNALAYILKSVN